MRFLYNTKYAYYYPFVSTFPHPPSTQPYFDMQIDMQNFFSEIHYSERLIVVFLGGAFSVICLLALYRFLDMIIGFYDSIKNHIPPLIWEKVIHTYTPKGQSCPLTVVTTRTPIIARDSGMFNEKISYIVACGLPGERYVLNLDPKHTVFSNETDALLYVHHKWPKRWQRWIYPEHPNGEYHYIVPKSWLREANDRTVNSILATTRVNS